MQKQEGKDSRREVLKWECRGEGGRVAEMRLDNSGGLWGGAF